MKMKFAKGGSTDEGSKNEAMRPSGRPDPEVARSIEGAAAEAAAKLAAIRRAQAAQRAERAAELKAALARPRTGMKKGGSVSSASKRADGCVTKGKTKGKFV